MGTQSGSDSKESACNAGDLGLFLGSGRFPGEGNDNPLQYSCLENPMDRGTWQTTVHGVPKSWIRMGDYHFHFRSMVSPANRRKELLAPGNRGPPELPPCFLYMHTDSYVFDCRQ